MHIKVCFEPLWILRDYPTIQKLWPILSFCKQRDRQTDRQNRQDKPFGIPRARVMEAIESLGCNWWKNMHEIDA